MKVGAITMQRDEADLLQAWVSYYSHLLGAENLTILNNGASDERTQRALQCAARAGVRIIPVEGGSYFARKGELISSYIREQAGYDWIIPADVDEFAGSMVHGKFSTARADLFGQLHAADESGRKLVRVNSAIWNIPHSTRGYAQPMKKIIAKPSAGVELDLGFHLYSWNTMSDMVDPATLYQSQVCYLHFHNRPLAELQERARLKLKDRMPDFRPERLRSYDGIGVHLAPYLLYSETDYLASLPSPDCDLRPILDPLNIPVPHSGGPKPRVSVRLAAMLRRLLRP